MATEAAKASRLLSRAQSPSEVCIPLGVRGDVVGEAGGEVEVGGARSLGLDLFLPAAVVLASLDPERLLQLTNFWP